MQSGKQHGKKLTKREVEIKSYLFVKMELTNGEKRGIISSLNKKTFNG